MSRSRDQLNLSSGTSCSYVQGVAFSKEASIEKAEKDDPCDQGAYGDKMVREWQEAGANLKDSVSNQRL